MIKKLAGKHEKGPRNLVQFADRRPPMTTVDPPVRRAGAAHPEEWWSILAALAAAGGTAAFLWKVPDFEPPALWRG